MFFKKNQKIFVFLFVLVFLLFSFFATISLNSDLRRSFFSKFIAVHDFYRIKKMKLSLENRDFGLISKRLQEYINFSKLISDDKNYMFLGIYRATDLAVSRAIEQDDYNNLEVIFKQLIKLDNRVYKPHVWYARALSDSDTVEALKHLNIAIEISPSEGEAYREIIRIGQSLNDLEMTSKYCKIYKQALSGGNTQEYPTLFNSFNNDKFAIKLFSKNQINYTDYLNATTLLNENNIYEFLPSKELTEIEGFNLYFSATEALKLKFKKIYYHDDNKIYEIMPKDVTITSQNSYIEENEENISIFLTPKKDEIIRIKHSHIENIKKIEIEMSIEKMNLASKSLCSK